MVPDSLFEENPLLYLLPFLREHCRGKDQGFDEKLNLGESIFLGNRERVEKVGSFRVLSFKRREWTSPIPVLAPVLGFFCGQSFNSTHMFVCGLAFCILLLAMYSFTLWS